jgi:hypothetical protein
MKRLATLLAAAVMLLSVIFLLLSSCTVGRMDALFLATAVPRIQVLDPDTGEPLDNGISWYRFEPTYTYASQRKQFVVANNGSQPLLIKKLYFLGNEHEEFILDSMLTDTTVPPGESTTFDVVYKLNSDENTAASLILENNDPGDGQYRISLQGEVLTGGGGSPHIEVTATEPPPGDFSPTEVGASSTKAYIIENTGTAALAILSVYPGGPASVSFTVVAPPDSTLEPAGTTSFTVQFTPQSPGEHNAEITVRSDDPDTPGLIIQVSGTGTVPQAGDPDIAVTRSGVPVPSGSVGYDFTNVKIGTIQGIAFRIENKGDSALAVTGFSVASSSGAFTADVTVSMDIQPAGSQEFQVYFEPSAAANYSAEIFIDCNDPDEDPYTFQVLGKGVSGSVPDISVWSGGREIPAGMVYNFGLCPIRNSVSKLLTIRNLGTSDLTVSVPLIVAGKDYSQSMTSPATVRPGGEHRLTVTFEPAEAGASTAKMLIRCNDADENPYIINLAGQGTD